jgi:hypothetical protein
MIAVSALPAFLPDFSSIAGSNEDDQDQDVPFAARLWSGLQNTARWWNDPVGYAMDAWSDVDASRPAGGIFMDREDALAAWDQIRKDCGERPGDPAYAEHLAFITRYRDRGYALARLQHYGIPTAALDVTHEPLVALFFATHSFKRTADGRAYYVPAEEEGVVYLLRLGLGSLVDLRLRPVAPPGSERGLRQHGGLVLAATDKDPDLSRYVAKKIVVSHRLFEELSVRE